MRFSSRRLARALELPFDAPLWIRDHGSGACLGRLRGWRGVRAEGMAEEAAAQPLVPHALWEAIAGLAATLIR